MPKIIDYAQKFAAFPNYPLYHKLPRAQQQALRDIAFAHRLTFQEFRQLIEAARDLAMWGEGDLVSWWQNRAAQVQAPEPQRKKQLLRALQEHLDALRRQPKVYPPAGSTRPKTRRKLPVQVEKTDKKIFGMCPVASEKTVCCNLRTIDAVENCAFGCSYCTIQTFYSEKFSFDADFAEKLKNIELEPDRYYHLGSGQSSDSLVWGNHNGNLQALCEFASRHPNVLLEFKTKSDNIRYFLENPVPPNIVCSWSLNPPVIIENEEHFTASLEQRLRAARRVADRGIKVAFHFHPIVYYQSWDADYPAIVDTLLATFHPDEVLFVSFGSVTLIKPAIQQIRALGHATKILQMPLVPDPHGKLTYPIDIKVQLFRTMHQAFAP